MEIERFGRFGIGRFGPPEDYDAIYKIAQSPTMLHFPPHKLKLKNISKIYFTLTRVFLDDILIWLGG